MDTNVIKAVISNLTKVRVVLGTVNIEAKHAADVVAIDNALTESIAALGNELSNMEKSEVTSNE